jgi:hypothetical protein
VSNLKFMGCLKVLYVYEFENMLDCCMPAYINLENAEESDVNFFKHAAVISWM